MHKVATGRELKEHAIWPKSTAGKRKSESRETYAVDDVSFVGKFLCRSCSSHLGSVILTDGDRLPGIKVIACYIRMESVKLFLMTSKKSTLTKP